MKEDKQKICDYLAEALRETRQLWDLVELKYDAKEETVLASFKDDYFVLINVEADSGVAMIRDIIKALD